MVSPPPTSSCSSPLPFPSHRLVITDTGEETESQILQVEDLPGLQGKFKASVDNLQNLSQNIYFLKKAANVVQWRVFVQ